MSISILVAESINQIPNLKHYDFEQCFAVANYKKNNQYGKTDFKINTQRIYKNESAGSWLAGFRRILYWLNRQNLSKYRR